LSTETGHDTGSLLKLLIFDLDGVITTEASYWDIARQGLSDILASEPRPLGSGPLDNDPLPLDFIYWVKNHSINHNWDVAFVALSAAGKFDEFRASRDHLNGRALLESCSGYRAELWKRTHNICQAIQDKSPLPSAGLHTPKEMDPLFTTLADRGYELAVATGRPKPEALAPLDALGIRNFFPENRIITHLEVEQAEREAHIPLGKPHPFVALRAIYPEMPLGELLVLPEVPRPRVWFIGDTASDVSAALAAGITPIGILSALPDGIYRDQRRKTLTELGCATILDSVLDLPSVLP
jgi:phosphoglycolate phosphatase-like HAD superfamily hydrolase